MRDVHMIMNNVVYVKKMLKNYQNICMYYVAFEKDVIVMKYY